MWLKRGRSTEYGSDYESISISRKKQCDHTEEGSARVKELKVKLQQRHGSDYSAMQYTLWVHKRWDKGEVGRHSHDMLCTW